MEMEGIQPSKPQRVIQACVRCQERKRRCDGETPACTACKSRGEECEYHGVRRRRGPGKSKQRIEALEKRLMEMESRLTPAEPSTNQETPKAPDVGETPLNDQRLSKESDAPSLKFSPPSQISEHHKRLFYILNDLTKRQSEYKAALDSIGSTPYNLPPMKPEEPERHLVDSSVDLLCDEFPFLDLPQFRDRVQQPDALEESKPLTWRCLFSALVSLAILSKSMNHSYEEVAIFAWVYFRNCYNELPGLSLLNHNLQSLQALLLMTIFMTSQADTQMTAAILSATVRKAQLTNLHNSDRWPHDLTLGETEARKRVFWTAYILDSDLSLKTGMPSLFAENDVRVEFPAQDPASSQNQSIAVFRDRAKLARIQSAIRERLYGARSLTQLSHRTMEASKDLSAVLNDWRAEFRVSILPDSGPGSREMGLSTVMLLLAYYSCVSMVHWPVFRDLTKKSTSNLPEDPFDQSIPTSEVTVSRLRTSARSTIGLLGRLGPQQFSDIWRMLHYQVAASITLLLLCLKDPTHAEARQDLESLNLLVRFVSKMVQSEGCDLKEVLQGCRGMAKLAASAIIRAEERASSGIQSEPPSNAGFLDLLTSIVHPMYMAQRLMGNYSAHDREVADTLASYVDMALQPGFSYGPFVPRSLRSDNFGFVPESEENSQSNRHLRR